jgi:hypothetical protein
MATANKITVNPNTVISDLRRELDQIHRLPLALRRPLQEAHRDHMVAAARLFGQINDWQLCDWFGPDRIGKAPDGRRDWDAPVWCRRGEVLFDHDIYYRRGRLRAAVVGQPYQQSPRAREAEEAGRRFGLVLHVPPQPTASLWYPGATLFLLLTEPDVTVRWLPEQISGMQSADSEKEPAK